MEQEKLEVKKLNEIIFSSESNTEMIEIVTVFLESVNDWPVEVLTLEDYEIEVKKFIKSETNYNNIELALKKINFSSESWESESLYQIKEIFKFYEKGITLNEIIQDLKLKLNSI